MIIDKLVTLAHKSLGKKFPLAKYSAEVENKVKPSSFCYYEFEKCINYWMLLLSSTLNTVRLRLLCNEKNALFRLVLCLSTELTKSEQKSENNTREREDSSSWQANTKMASFICKRHIYSQEWVRICETLLQQKTSYHLDFSNKIKNFNISK